MIAPLFTFFPYIYEADDVYVSFFFIGIEFSRVNHEMEETCFEWKQLAFPFTTEFGGMRFGDAGTTYHAETYTRALVSTKALIT